MKKILCFGDSNTYGYIPKSGKRYDKDTRWSGVLQKLLGDDYLVIEEGCNNRTCVQKNAFGKYYTGLEILPEYLEKDLDIVILLIGINDLQISYNADLIDLRCGMKELVNLIQKKSPYARVILLSPPNLNEGVLSGYFSSMFDKKSIEKSLLISKIYEELAVELQCEFFDLNKIVKASNLDGLHLETQEHKKIAEYLVNIIKNIKS